MSVLFFPRTSRTLLAAVSALSLMATPMVAFAQTPPPPHPAQAEAAKVAEQDLTALQARLTAGETTSEALVRAYLYRIGTLDQSGPGLNSVLSINPDALKQAQALDAERKAGKVRGPLHGLPILLKDNIETLDPLPTTAGSLALKDNVTGRDAPVAARLRAAGAIILGKTNLSEWANIRSPQSSSGWSAVGGQTRNAYSLAHSPCGSSSGSGTATAASLAGASVGTETDGSIVCPSAMNGLVGIKPTVGLVSRTHIVPISHSQDTAGPMTRTVRDAALMLTAMAGTDPKDAATKDADPRKSDYTKALKADALKGVRLGVMRPLTGYSKDTDAVFEAALKTLQAQGAVLVEITDPLPRNEMGAAEFQILLSELKSDLGAYLASTDPTKVPVRSLKDAIAFNQAHPQELMFFGQEFFELAEATQSASGEAYTKAVETARRLSRTEGIDALRAKYKVAALIAPTTGPAWKIDPVNGDDYSGSASGLAAVAGYPHITVPMGAVKGLPVGLSFFAEAWSEARLIGLAYSFEQAAKARKAPTF